MDACLGVMLLCVAVVGGRKSTIGDSGCLR